MDAPMMAPMQPQPPPPMAHMAPAGHAVPQTLPPGGYVTVSSAGGVVTHAQLMQHPGTPQHAILGQHHPHPITFTPGSHSHQQHHIPSFPTHMAKLQRPLPAHSHHKQSGTVAVNGAIVSMPPRASHAVLYTHQQPPQHLSSVVLGGPRKAAPIIALPMHNGKGNGVNRRSVDSKELSGPISQRC